MPLSNEDLEAERRKAKHLAMRQALEMLERGPSGGPGLCATCATWQEKCAADGRRYCQDIDHLRRAVQRLLDTLATYVSGPCLKELTEVLELDTRVFKLPDAARCFAPGTFCSDREVASSELIGEGAREMGEELAALKAQLKTVMEERDLAKMKLGVVGRELAELKARHQDLSQCLASANSETTQKQNEREKRFARVEARLCELEEKVAGVSGVRAPSPHPPQLPKGARRRCIDAERGRTGMEETDRDEERLRDLERKMDSLDARSPTKGMSLALIDLALRPPRSADAKRLAPLEVGGQVEKHVPKGLRSRSSHSAHPIEAVPMARGPSSQLIKFDDHDLQEQDVGAYLRQRLRGSHTASARQSPIF